MTTLTVPSQFARARRRTTWIPAPARITPILSRLARAVAFVGLGIVAIVLTAIAALLWLAPLAGATLTAIAATVSRG